MSAEGKKKRGEAGQSNAKNIAFRYHGYPRNIANTGWHYSLSTAIGGTSHPRMAGSRLLHTMEWAQLLPGFNPSERLIKATDAAIDHILARHANTATARTWGTVE